jgi:2-keto-4-pentenoate hydratase
MSESTSLHVSMPCIDAAAQALLDARAAPRGRLDEDLRPQSMEQALAIQHAVLNKAQERVGGWKVGRIDGLIYSALLPDKSIVDSDLKRAESVIVPAGSKIELELATRFHKPVAWRDVADLTLDGLPSVAECVALFEFVCSRFLPDAGQDALEKIADNVSTARIVTGSSTRDWTMQSLRVTHAVLHENNAEVARHDGPHLAEPLMDLFTVWKDRCVQEQRDIEPGQLITWGSLSGVRPVPDIGADYDGQVGKSLTVRCRAAV